MTQRFTSLILAFSLFMSCQKLDTLSGSASIDAFIIAEHTPIITISTPVIANDTVHIPILDGEDNFPLKFRAKVLLSSGTEKIFGIDFNQEQELRSANSMLKFFVMAENGVTRTYYICPKRIEGNNYLYKNVEVISSSPQSIISSIGEASLNDTFKIYGALLEYPVKLKLNLKIASDASFGSYWTENGDTSLYKNGETELIFENNKTIRLKVIANNGAVRDWHLQLVNTRMIKGRDPLDHYMLENTALNIRSTSSISKTQGVRIYDTRANNITDTITLQLDKVTAKRLKLASKNRTLTRGVELPSLLEVELSLGLSDYVDIINTQQISTISFTSWEDSNEFYLLDKNNRVTRKWTVVLEEVKYDLANVLAFHFDYTAAMIKSTSNGSETTPSISLDSLQTKIYPEQKLIQLVATEVGKEFNTPYSTNNKNWRLNLNNLSVVLSDGAHCELPSAFEWKSTYVKGLKVFGTVLVQSVPDTGVNQIHSFEVIAENGKIEQWRLSIKVPSSTLNSACNIDRVHIKSLVPHFASVDAETPTVIDQDNLHINIKLSDDRGAYPLSVYANYEISAHSTISNKEGAPLIFNDANTLQTLLITAEDGTTKEYTISLITPIKAEGADIKDIVWGTMSTEFSFYKSVIYDTANAIIHLPITSNDAAFPLSINYNSITLSEGASVNLPSRGTFTFRNPTDDRPIMVSSEAGASKFWILKLLYAPQFKNASLNTWNYNLNWADNHCPSPDKYWANANTNVIGIKIVGCKN
ncbi:MAG: hypothetical protein ACRC3G_06840, partial [Bacteroidales bacterium]